MMLTDYNRMVSSMEMKSGTITTVPGDNLASQYLGGYKQFSRALRKCRQCIAVNEDMQAIVSTCFV